MKSTPLTTWNAYSYLEITVYLWVPTVLLLFLMFSYHCIFIQTPSRQLVFDTGSSCPQTSPSSCTSCSYTCPGKDVSNFGLYLSCPYPSLITCHLQTTGATLAAYYYNYNGSGQDMICIFNDDAECLYDVSSRLFLERNAL
jgi:hypothetical protein